MKPGTPGRPPTCVCGECKRCKHAAYMRQYCLNMSTEKRHEVIANRQKQTTEQNQARHARRKADPVYSVKRKARTTASNAIRDGHLLRQPCEICGNAATDAHHEDYTKPLEVRWLCRAHHGQEHRMAA
jgi:hypothetical protein